MATKVLINNLGQHIIADVKQVENNETGEVVAYWVKQPRVVSYVPNEETGDISIRFVDPCPISDENEYSIRVDSVVSILEPKDSVTEGYTKIVYPNVEEITASIEGEEEVEGE